MDKAALIALARQTAQKYALDETLVCAVCEQESNWNTWAIRYEPLFMTKYVAPLYTSLKISATEAYARSISWGLMQVMGQVAREHLFADPIPSLCDPAKGIDMGCKILKQKIAFDGDMKAGLLRYNGGGNALYANEVVARMQNYVPIIGAPLT